MLRRPSTRAAAVLLAILLAAAPPHAFAQNAQNAQNAQHRERKHLEREQIVALEQQWQQAMLADDIPTMDKLLSDDYLGITATGEVLTKTQQLDRMGDRKFVITKLETSDRKIKLVGNIAIVTCLAQIQGSSDDEPLDGAFRYTRVYQRMPGGLWKVTSFEVTPATRLHALPPMQN
jgi:ketosteroid isomerase-like protein